MCSPRRRGQRDQFVESEWRLSQVRTSTHLSCGHYRNRVPFCGPYSNRVRFRLQPQHKTPETCGLASVATRHQEISVFQAPEGSLCSGVGNLLKKLSCKLCVGITKQKPKNRVANKNREGMTNICIYI